MRRKFVLIFLAVLLIAKVVGVIARGPSPLVFDAKYYWQLGGVVLDGDWLLLSEPIAYRTPGYPWLLGAIRGAFPDPLFVLVCLQGVLWLGTVAFAALIARELTGRIEAAVLVLVGAVPMLSSLTYVSTVLSETLFVFLMVFHLWFVVRFARSPSIVGGVFCGVTLGLTILTRPVGMLVWIADVIFLIASWYGASATNHPALCRRRGWIAVLVAGVVTVACVTPWLARNHALFGRAMLTEFVGRNVWIVTFQDGSGAELDWPDSAAAERLRVQVGPQRWASLGENEQWRNTWKVSKSLTGSGLDDPSADRLMKRVAFDAIGTSPSTFAWKAGRRWVNFWRTRATELPPQVADFPAIAEPGRGRAERGGSEQGGSEQDGAGQGGAGHSFAGQPTWGVTVAPIDTGLRYRWSNSLSGNTLLMFVTAASVMLLVWNRRTRPAGLWLAAILGYFCSVTAALEIPAYRYRMIVEPVVLVSLASAVTTLRFSKSQSFTKPLPEETPCDA